MTTPRRRRTYREGVPTLLTRLFDAGLAAVLVVLGVLEVWVPLASRSGSGSATVSAVVVVVLGLGLLFRRSHPLPSALVVLCSWPLVFTITPVYVLFLGQFVPMAVAVFSVARHGRGREPWVGAAVGAGTLLFFDLRVQVLQEPSEIIFHWGVFVVAWSFGWGQRLLEIRARASQQRAITAEVESSERAMSAVVAERTRIARELHDIVAHSVSMMVVQAGAAEQAVDDDPAFVRRALSTIRTSGTGALQEMRRVVAMLRDDDEVGMLAPQPGMEGIGALVDDARDSGVEVQLSVQGTPRPLPVGVDLAAYRIVQEALTNVRRHASASQASVLLHYGDDEVRIEVCDDGVGMSGPAADGATGHGLIGMRERVALYGGRLEAGSSGGRGFTVRAALPVAPG